MSNAIKNVFSLAKKEGRPVFIAFTTLGYPTAAATVDVVRGLVEGGADIVELGVPFTDPIADGPTIQRASHAALDNGTDSLEKCFAIGKAIRQAGITIPLLFMGYCNPFLQYDANHRDKGLASALKANGINGVILVDLPLEESVFLRNELMKEGLSFVPLVTPTTTNERLSVLSKASNSFLYCVSTNGVTGERASVNRDLPQFIERIRTVTDLPLAIGFGIGDRESFKVVGDIGDGVVVGSAIINAISRTDMCTKLKDNMALIACELTGRKREECVDISARSSLAVETTLHDDMSGNDDHVKYIEDIEISVNKAANFGEFGGRFVPETLVHALSELELVYDEAKMDPIFWEEYQSYFPYIGRPSSLHLANRLTEFAGGARIWLKREDLNHTGAHKINNAVGQAILAKRLGKKRIIAETGAGQHGVATATVCAKLGLELTVYMGAEDCQRQALNVFRMELLGAEVVPVNSGSKTLKDAINEAMRDWVTNITTTHYLVGSAIGPHPFPSIVRDFQSVIGKEARDQMLNQAGKLPDVCVACVGGGSNAIGLFHPFINDTSVRLVGVEAAGEGLHAGHSATLSAGHPGVLHGTRTYILQNQAGQITETHSISAGLDYPGVGPEHAWLKETGRAEYVAVTDQECLDGFKKLSQLEGIIPALESSHAIYTTIQIASQLTQNQDVLVCVSGRGDKDVDTVRTALLTSEGTKQ